MEPRGTRPVQTASFTQSLWFSSLRVFPRLRADLFLVPNDVCLLAVPRLFIPSFTGGRLVFPTLWQLCVRPLRTSVFGDWCALLLAAPGGCGDAAAGLWGCPTPPSGLPKWLRHGESPWLHALPAVAGPSARRATVSRRHSFHFPRDRRGRASVCVPACHPRVLVGDTFAALHGFSVGLFSRV